MEAQPVAQQLGDFDLRQVEIRDPKTQRVLKRNPYKLHVVDGVQYVEHPKGSGNLWYPNKEFAGRYEAGKIVLGKAHEVWNPPPTEDEKLAMKHATLEQENARLMRELEEIKKEQAKAAKPVNAQAAPKPAAGVKNV